MQEYKVSLHFQIIDQGLRKSLLSLQFLRGKISGLEKKLLK